MVRIAASILSADRVHLDDEVRRVVAAGADALHLNVIDSHDRPNLMLGHMVCAQLRPHCSVPIGVHLRVPAVDALVERFAEAGADLITVHGGVPARAEETLRLIRRVGCQVGLAFDPAEPLDRLPSLMDLLDVVHVSCAAPASASRNFLDSSLRKIEQARRLIDASGRALRLQVDGDISADNIAAVAAAGADSFVVGRAIFGQADYRQAVASLRGALAAPGALRRAA